MDYPATGSSRVNQSKPRLVATAETQKQGRLKLGSLLRHVLGFRQTEYEARHDMRGLTDTRLAKSFNPTLTRVRGWWRNEYNRRTANDEPLRTQQSNSSNVLPWLGQIPWRVRRCGIKCAALVGQLIPTNLIEEQPNIFRASSALYTLAVLCLANAIVRCLE